MKIVMGKFVFDSSHVYEYAFYINDQLIIATNDDNFGFGWERPEFCVNGQM